jgi:hypothetical protein
MLVGGHNDLLFRYLSFIKLHFHLLFAVTEPAGANEQKPTVLNRKMALKP